MISHWLGVARMADRSLVMDGGKVVEERTYADLL